MTTFTAYQTLLRTLVRKNEPPEESRASARILLDEISGFSHAHLTHGDDLLNPSQIARLQNAIDELINGRPLAHILGKRDFYKLRFASDARALVPRPETELLIEEIIQRARSRSTPELLADELMMADLGTGTGCIAISLAHELPHAQVFATDVSPEALSLARENAQNLIPEIMAKNRLQFRAGVLGKWATPLVEYSGQFDFVVSNPPYIAREEIETLQREVRDFEPRLALDGGIDGLDCYRQLASQCGVLLKPGGALLCELGMGQFDDVRMIFEAQNWRVEKPIFDFAGIARVLVAQPTS